MAGRRRGVRDDRKSIHYHRRPVGRSVDKDEGARKDYEQRQLSNIIGESFELCLQVTMKKLFLLQKRGSRYGEDGWCGAEQCDSLWSILLAIMLKFDTVMKFSHVGCEF